MCILFVSFTASPAVVYGAKWNGVVRPGVMVGDSENETDFFLDIFLPLKEYQAGFVFVNPHIRLGDDGSHEGNLGLGYRGLYNDRYILGANAFLDTMESGEGNRFNQFGLGAELMSHWFDARANYYNPIGDDKKREPGLDEFRFGPSSLLQALGYEEALGGFDAEVGALIPGISDFMETRAYVGAYWYDSDIVDDDDVDGFKYRVEVRPAPAIDLIAEFKDDDIRGNDTFFGGYIELPFEDLLSFKVAKNAFSFGQGARPIKDRMMDKVVRDRHIQTVMGPEAPGNESIAYPMIYVNQDNDSGTDGCDDPSLVGTTCDGAGTLTDPYEDIGSVEYD
ncbi:MAG TPA: inverse autotransporter beta domain-containing protein, partial [Thermodesulfobacteriota bacterium]|nr:inverse autotransporter beta domain-containing protein [Thermodesulfobacteriota bacterium]